MDDQFSFLYEGEPTIPEGMTVAEYRRSAQRPAGRLAKLVARLRGQL